MTQIIRLQTAEDFFKRVTKPGYDTFMNEPSSFINVFAMAMGLFNISEWFFELHRQEIEAYCGCAFTSASKLWEHVESVVPEAAYIRDLSNASKHVVLKKNPSTDAKHVANTFITPSYYGTGYYDSGTYGRNPVRMDENGATVSVDDCALKVFNFWAAAVVAIFPPPTSITAAAAPSANS